MRWGALNENHDTRDVLGESYREKERGGGWKIWEGKQLLPIAFLVSDFSLCGGGLPSTGQQKGLTGLKTVDWTPSVNRKDFFLHTEWHKKDCHTGGYSG